MVLIVLWVYTDTFIQTVEQGKTYLLGIINAALNGELFFAVSNHTLTVVEIDATYTKPLTTKAIMIAPGQTTNVLLTTNQLPADPSGAFAMAATPYVTSVFPFDNSTTVGFLRYKQTPKFKPVAPLPPPKSFKLHNLPLMEDTDFAANFSASLKSLASPRHPCQDCPSKKTCKRYEGKSFYASLNNQSFIRPNSLSLLESYYINKLGKTSPYGRLMTGFPEKRPFDYTGADPLAGNLNTEFGTKILVFPYGTNVEIVLQGTSHLNKENHSIHVHGHKFFGVGMWFGNFDSAKDPGKYNLVDPPERNTVAVPTGSWAAIRFKADDPGVWFVHCHLEEHTSWGLATAFIVENGPGPNQSLLPPPAA